MYFLHTSGVNVSISSISSSVLEGLKEVLKNCFNEPKCFGLDLGQGIPQVSSTMLSFFCKKLFYPVTCVFRVIVLLETMTSCKVFLNKRYEKFLQNSGVSFSIHYAIKHHYLGVSWNEIPPHICIFAGCLGR